jgi:uncharacterized repeat protein (TIGR01451 family)
MTLRANPVRAFPVLLAFLFNLVVGPLAPLAQSGLVSAAPNDGIEDYAQCQIGDGAGLDCAVKPEVPEPWTNGILNDTHNDYAEDEVVPQRLQMAFEPGSSHSVTIRYMTRKDSSGQRHAYDYLATYNYTYENADRCQELPSGVNCVGGAADTLDIPSDPNAVSPGGPQPTSAHELPQADRQFTMYGGTLNNATTPVHSVDPGEAGSDYASITVSFTVGAGGQIQLLWGGHLASGFGPRGWGENLGAAAISGGPYHMIVDAVDGESIGQRDNQIMSNAIEPLLPTLAISKTPDGGSVTAGDYASFTVTVTNNGPGAATNVDIDDTLPAGPSANLVWAEFPDMAECTVVANALHCDIASLADDASFAVTVRALTDADDCGVLNNTAFADADNNPAVSDTGEITVLCGDVAVDKTPDGGQVSAGDAAAFTIVTSNTGNGEARDVELSDVLPAVANGWAVDSEDWDGDCTITGAAGADQTLECGPEDIEADGSRSVTVETVTTADDCGLLDNPIASATTSNDGSDEDAGDITVLCPDLDALKEADDSVVSAGQAIGFTITVSNSDAAGTGTAYNVELNDPLPAGSDLDWSEDPDSADCEITGSLGAQTLECSFGDLAPGESASVHVVSDTTKLDCATYPNVADITSDNHEELNPSADTTVECPGLNISKLADNGEIVAGDTASYTVVVWNKGPGTALDASWSDELPNGVSWSVELLSPDGDDACASSLDSDGNQAASCQFGDLAPSSMEDGKVIVVSGETDREDCAGLGNTAFAFADNADTVQASASIAVRCPILVIEKSADTETVHFVFDAGGNVLSVDPEQVTWTLTYTLTEGPVTDAVITDPLPEFLVFVSASDGGDYDEATHTITWELGDLSEDGSFNVSFVTTVDPGAPQTDPILNVATIVSNETPEDDGQDSIVLTSESQLGGNPTPKPSVPNTAVVFGPAGEPISIPVELLAFLFIGSLGTLAYANVRAARRRR